MHLRWGMLYGIDNFIKVANVFEPVHHFKRMIVNQTLTKKLVKAVKTTTLFFFSSAQVMMELPVHVHEKHHVLFIFYHISCESSSKASNKGVESLGKPSPLPRGNLSPNVVRVFCFRVSQWVTLGCLC